MRKDRLTLLKSIHIYKKHRVQYEIRTHFTHMNFHKLTGSTADTFLEYVQRNLPEGVSMKVTKVLLTSLRHQSFSNFNEIIIFNCRPQSNHYQSSSAKLRLLVNINWLYPIVFLNKFVWEIGFIVPFDVTYFHIIKVVLIKNSKDYYYIITHYNKVF